MAVAVLIRVISVSVAVFLLGLLGLLVSVALPIAYRVISVCGSSDRRAPTMVHYEPPLDPYRREYTYKPVA